MYEITDRVLLFHVKTGELIETLGRVTDPDVGEVQGYHGWVSYYEKDPMNYKIIKWSFYSATMGMYPEELRHYLPVNNITRTLYTIKGLKEYEKQYGPIGRAKKDD